MRMDVSEMIMMMFGWIVWEEDELDGHKGGWYDGNFNDVREMLVDITIGNEVHEAM